ncbi:carboxylesterase/lipase family protein [Terriglobus sp. 2YAB30_2]|uniref:carboxylesterase/lipase family protein n=1 Tax=Terriglobus sp. 2YAB30_2 TaxID=3233023 RepID=UPI003F9B8C38
MKIRTTLLGGVLACFSAGLVHAQASAPQVKTAQGEAVGKWIHDGKEKAFLGLPYAAPPVGNLRWKAPEPPSAWSGTRDATKFGHRCQQWHIWDDYIFTDAGPSEDCLYLNVYTPAAAKQGSKLPVMVWIHGGGFLAGAASEPRYTNPALVAKGVIVVTLNYRLNVFGFLASEDLAREQGGHAGNYGFMDQVAALRWVKANIAAFGGDANNVTIFGESAGSFAVSALTVAPSARGLFHKVIGESGAFFGSTIPMTAANERAKRDQAFVAALGANNLEELRALPAGKILEATQKQSGIGFSAVVDGAFLPESLPDAYAAGRQTHVPSIIGWNRDERAGTLSKDMTAEKWKAYAKEHYGAKADEFLAAFPASTDEQAIRSADDFTTNGFIAMGAWRWAEAQSKTGQSPVYRFRFDRPAPAEPLHPTGKYAFHSTELEYVFGTLDVRQGATWQSADRKLSDEVVIYWTNFARTGDPNGNGLPTWPRYDKEKKLIHLDDPITVTLDTTHAEFEFLASEPSQTR